ncbi:MAG TPA: hydrolase 2, exosortase A system-associated [Telluria sp.]|nr:hydrolase 2, exosortase A system-associated [Telluria sp.]
MDPAPELPHAQPFFLTAHAGRRFCLFHPTEQAPRGAVLYVHPFAEEMNKSRRMAAFQARALAAAGIAVLQIDLYGCGDSSGDFANARWEVWLEDVDLGMRWLARRSGCTPALLGLRLGGTLAVDFAASCGQPVDSIVLWSPVVDGEAYLRQFLRLRSAAGMLGGGSGEHPQASLLALRDGQALEVAGYDLTPVLANMVASRSLAALLPPSVPVTWIDIGGSPAPASEWAVQSWRERGLEVDLTHAAGAPFWSTQEITLCPALLEATTRALAGAANAC